jgi:hypothetical protein
MVATLGAMVAGASPASAQSLRGAVVDSISGRPVAGARVLVVTSTGTTVAGAVTAADGRFSFQLPADGTYRIRATGIGYSPSVTEPFAVPRARDGDVLVRLAAIPISLDTLRVVGKRVVVEKKIHWLAETGFYERRHEGFGYFLTRADIEEKSPLIMTDALQGLAGIQVRCTGPRACRVTMPGARTMFFRGKCEPSIVLDGVVVSPGGIGDSGRVNDLLEPLNIEAVEVYPSAAGIPPQWGGYLSPCGAIVAWSRR